MRGLLVFVWILTALRFVTASTVIEATDDNFEELLAKGIPTVLDIYASWCSHCKKLAPELDIVSDYYAHAQDKVQFIKIDGDANRKLSKKFKVEYFPLIKFLTGEEAANGELGVELPAREAEGMADYVYEQTGIAPKKPKVPQSDVIALNDGNFVDTLKGKSALVSFTASWCGHCKNLKPEYEKLATIHKRDSENILIANVDCTGEGTTNICDAYNVRSYPTILYLDKDRENDLDFEQYSEERSIFQFLDYLAEKQVSFRTPEGGLSSLAGRIKALDDIIASKGVSGITKDALLEIYKQQDEAKAKFANIYERYAAKASESSEYVSKEIARLSKLIRGAKISPEKVDQLQLKLNILNAFNGKGSDEREAKEDL